MPRLPVVALALAVLASPAGAQGNLVQTCQANPNPQQRIAACSTLLSQGGARLSANDRATALALRAAAYSEIKDLDRALADADAALRAVPNFAPALARRGAVHVQKGDLSRALPDLDAALRLNPQDAFSLYFRSAVRSGRNDFRAAVTDLSKAVALAPNVVFIRKALGDMFFRLEEYDNAAREYGEALRIAPNSADALAGRGNVKLFKGELDAAISDYEGAIRLDARDSTFFNNRGVAYLRKGEIGRAVADLDTAIGLPPRTARPHFHKGRIFEDAKDLNRALSEYETALSVDPTDKDAQAGRDRVKTALAVNLQPERLLSQSSAASVAALPAAAPSKPAAASAKPVAAPPGSRIALVIGNSAYQTFAKLENPRNDASDIGAALQTLGFEVTLALDAKRSDMEDKLSAFARAARTSEVALVFYAGHGMQHQGVNYLAPVDASIQDESDLRRLIKVQDVLGDLSNAKGVRILMLDACRDNEVIRQLAAKAAQTRSAAQPRGLARIKAEGVLIAFATQPDTTALDGVGRNSPFTEALLRNLANSGQDIRILLTRVRSEVLKATQGGQRPEVADSLDGEFSFN